MSKLWQLSAADIAKMVSNKEVSAEEVASSHLGRIDEVNPVLNALTLLHWLFESTLGMNFTGKPLILLIGQSPLVGQVAELELQSQLACARLLKATTLEDPSGGRHSVTGFMDFDLQWVG